MNASHRTSQLADLLRTITGAKRVKPSSNLCAYCKADLEFFDEESTYGYCPPCEAEYIAAGELLEREYAQDAEDRELEYREAGGKTYAPDPAVCAIKGTPSTVLSPNRELDLAAAELKARDFRVGRMVPDSELDLAWEEAILEDREWRAQMQWASYDCAKAKDECADPDVNEMVRLLCDYGEGSAHVTEMSYQLTEYYGVERAGYVWVDAHEIFNNGEMALAATDALLQRRKGA